MKPIIPLLLLCLSSAGAATNDATRNPEQKPPKKAAFCMRVKADDKAMDMAVTKARESLGFFLAALQAKKPDSTSFEVKKCFVDGDKVEHIWIDNVTWDGKEFHGRVDNEPLDITSTGFGRRVTVTPADLTDWMFVKDGKLMGGFTMRVLYARMAPEEKAAFQKQADFKLN